MSNITENEIEEFAIELLEKQGFQYLYGPDIAPDSDTPMRTGFDDVLIAQKLREAIDRLNPSIPAAAREDAYKQVLRIHSPEMIDGNETFHKILTEGVSVSYQKDGGTRGDLVWLIDFDNIENNEFHVVNQFTIIENERNKRPDVILFINGLPLVVMELKNPGGENATVGSAYKQMQTYKSTIPSLFTYNAVCVISDGLEARAGSLTAGLTRYMAWKSADGKMEASRLIGQLETLITGMLNRKTLLDIVQNFIAFTKTKKKMRRLA